MKYLAIFFSLASGLTLSATALLGLSACQHSSTISVEASSEKGAPVEQVKGPVTESEHITWTMLTINGKPHQELTTQQLLNQSGRPDSIAKGAIECGSLLTSLNQLNRPDGDCWYYGKTTYDVGGTQAVLSSFDATKGNFSGRVGSLVLNQHTTLADVQRYFPIAAQRAQASVTRTAGWDKVVHLPFYKQGVSEEASLELFFQHGQLQTVGFYSPC